MPAAIEKTPVPSAPMPPIPTPGEVGTRRVLNSIQHHLKYTRCKNWGSATDFDKYLSLAYAIRDLAVDKMIATQGAYQVQDVKRVYYLSMEFLMGRLLANNITALGAGEATGQAPPRDPQVAGTIAGESAKHP